MNEAMQKKYLDSNGLICPYCGSAHIEPISPLSTKEDGTVVQDIVCTHCNIAWVDEFTLTGANEYEA